MAQGDPLEEFHPLVRRWFRRAFGEPSPPQRLGWPHIAAGENTLILAPTGSGKTLASFLWAINHVVEQLLAAPVDPGVRILYVSPLKALNNDIARNLEVPLAGIRQEALAAGATLPEIRTAVRTGDTSPRERRAIATDPPQILITTPESLYLMLTSPATRLIFRTLQYVIVDEIHAVCGNKRGVHLSISLERLQEVADQELVRVGLSATQRPLEQVAEFLGGYSPAPGEAEGYRLRPVAIVDAGRRKDMDLQVICAPDDFSLLPQDSVWPLVFDEIMDDIRQHRTTLIFVNNRRLAERVAAALNERLTEVPGPVTQLYNVPRSTAWSDPDHTAPHAATEAPQLIQAYHGSMSREAREEMEQKLKAGELRALVSTSALELGIDIGTVDLVIQLQSPHGIARGLQRVGRSGHLVSATSKGRIFASHREDLVESVVVAKAMAAHEVEITTIPRNALDVLAQQIIAMVAVEPWPVDRLFSIIRRSACYHTLTRELYTRVLDMLAGRFAHEAFRDLRPRISWDRVNNVLAALPGTRHLATTSGGTIADRGYFGVYLEDGRTRVGEVDEEFVYESRTGDTFLLGSSVWRVMDIDANRIIVAPAPGQPARMPFWRGEGIGRSFELGRAIGAFRRELEEQSGTSDALQWLQREYPVDPRGAWNVLEYARRQKEATGFLPTDRQLIFEAFRDEVGDPRVVLHCCFGRRVNGLLGLYLAHVMATRTGVEPQMLYNDDGVLLRCHDADEIPLDLFAGLVPEEAERLVLDEVLNAPLFGGQFRQNAGRALLMPRAMPGKRTPMWLQRLRATDLLHAVRQFEDFPIVIETVREVLNDVLDFPRFRELLRQITEGSIVVSTVRTEFPSPFAAGLLFDFIAVYMYEWDQPRQDRQTQYLTLNRELLSSVVDIESIGELIKPAAIEDIEAALQHAQEGYRARTPEELMELLVRLGDLSEEEIAARVEGDGRAMLEALTENGRAVLTRQTPVPLWVAGENRGLYEHLGDEDATAAIIRRYVEHHGPVGTRELARRYGISEDRIQTTTARWDTDRSMVRGRFRPVPTGHQEDTEWCYRPNLEAIHKRSVVLLRKEIHPCTFAEFTRFAIAWHRPLLPSSTELSAALEEQLEHLAGLALPAELWEMHILPRFAAPDAKQGGGILPVVPGFVWSGDGPGRLRVFRRGEGALFLEVPDAGQIAALREGPARVYAFLKENGASFFADIRNETGMTLAALNNALAELFWAGSLTNDNLPEILALKRGSRAEDDEPVTPVQVIGPHSRRRFAPIVQHARRALKEVPGWNGRWSLLHHSAVMGPALPPGERAARLADILLERHGILAREFCRRNEVASWGDVIGELQRRELRGEIRRGYFVEGLSGMQFALPAAVDRVRQVRSVAAAPGLTLLNAADPANPYGNGIDPPFAGARNFRTPSSYFAFAAGVPVLLAELNGERLFSAPDADRGLLMDALRALIALTKRPSHCRPFRQIHVRSINGTTPATDALAPLLQELGFIRDAGQTLRYEGFA
jgi:ATP-dependent helicase Lhr and Lhr-like helicase